MDLAWRVTLPGNVPGKSDRRSLGLIVDRLIRGLINRAGTTKSVFPIIHVTRESRADSQLRQPAQRGFFPSV